MESIIPFVNSAPDCDRLGKYYSDCDVIRVSLESINSIENKLPKKKGLWIDAGIDGYENLLNDSKTPSSEWETYINQFRENKILSEPSFLKNPDLVRLQKFVDSVLDECLKYRPSWITVPQLPCVNDSGRNKINKELAKAVSAWCQNRNYSGKWILPLIFTHKDQIKGKVQWKAKFRTAKKWCEDLNASGIWAVDSTLNDQQGSSNLDKRFGQLIELHKDLNDFFPKDYIVIAGPYWGMNLVLWARGLCEYIGVSLGTGYRYFISGGFRSKGKVRLAIPPLRRWAIAGPDLREWLENALNLLGKSDPAYEEILNLKENYELVSQSEIARDQIAREWKRWFNKIEAVQPAGRTLALYQDLSSAYVIGKKLPELSRSEKTARFPARVARQLMLNCL
ncbi:hypothetical protein ACFL2O_11125 [Thermodesulfobacteriota bacterium]